MKRFSPEQRTGLFNRSNNVLDENIVYGTLLRDPEKRLEVNRWIADAIEIESQHYGAGFDPENGNERERLQRAVYNRVKKQNEKYGLVFEIVLMAVLSWLIGKWLDYIFAYDSYPA